MILRFFAFLLLAFVPLTALAQDVPDAARRLELAGEMHKIWPVRPKVESALESVVEGVDEGKRAAFKAALRKAMDYQTIERESIKAMADVFSAEELEAMVAFYGSPAGRSVSAKTEDYTAALQPVIVRMLDNAILQIRTGNGPDL